MKTAYVAGFFTPVELELRSAFGAHFESASIVWIPQRSNGQLDLNRLKSDILRQAKEGVTSFLICAFVFRNQQFLWDAIEAIILSVKDRHPLVTSELIRFSNARNVDGLRVALGAFGPTREVAYPDSLDEIDLWCARHFADRLVILPRALRGARSSVYSDVKLVFRALHFLANEYRDLRLASPDSRPRCTGAVANKLNELAIELSASISQLRAGEQGDEYMVNYPIGGEKKVILDLHLKKGSDRDARNCLRIYFFWDDVNKVAVIGWMTSHLDTRAT